MDVSGRKWWLCCFSLRICSKFHATYTVDVFHICFGIKGWCKKCGHFSRYLNRKWWISLCRKFSTPRKSFTVYGVASRGSWPWLLPETNLFAPLRISWIAFQSTIFASAKRFPVAEETYLMTWMVCFSRRSLSSAFRLSWNKKIPPNIRRWNYLAIWRLNQFRLKSCNQHVQSDLWEDCWLPENWSWNIWAEPRSRMNLIELFGVDFYIWAVSVFYPESSFVTIRALGSLVSCNS